MPSPSSNGRQQVGPARRQSLAQVRKLGEVGVGASGVLAHLRHHGPQHHSRRRMRRILRPHDQDGATGRSTAWRRDVGVAVRRTGRFAQRLFPVEAVQPVLGLGDLVLDRAHACGGVDQLRSELAAIVADRVDLALEARLGLQRLALLGTDIGQILLALLERVETARLLGRDRSRGTCGCGGAGGSRAPACPAGSSNRNFERRPRRFLGQPASCRMEESHRHHDCGRVTCQRPNGGTINDDLSKTSPRQEVPMI